MHVAARKLHRGNDDYKLFNCLLKPALLNIFYVIWTAFSAINEVRWIIIKWPKTGAFTCVLPTRRLTCWPDDLGCNVCVMNVSVNSMQTW
jgi:hypothetical protein